jgi:biopolymer transport protein ExbD
MIRRRTRIELPEASINLTSLMDITFVLLISFMIVAPAVKYNVDLELPKASDSSNPDSKKPITVQVSYEETTKSTAYFVNGRERELSQVAGEVKSLPSWTKNSAISVEGDRDLPWEAMAALMSHLTANEITNIGIVTEKR